MATVSVVVPAYNAEQYIEDALTSIFAQTYTDFEVIVVDDGSTDNTREIVNTFNDPRLRYVYQKNAGPSVARNTGINLSRSEYIAFLDADDQWEPQFLEQMLAVLEEDPSADAAYCGFQYMDSNAVLLPNKVYRGVPPERFRDELFKDNWLSSCEVVIRRSALQVTGGFDPSFSFAEDYDLWLRLSKRSKFVGIPLFLVRYRLTKTGLSGDINTAFASLLRLAEKHAGAVAGPPSTWSARQRSMYMNAYRFAALRYTEAGNLREARRYLKRALIIMPELINDLDLWYTLGCAHQPVGNRGDFSSLDISKSKNDLISLTGVFDCEAESLHHLKDIAFGYSYLALGLLSYGCRNLKLSRHYLLKSVGSYPKLLFHKRLLVTLLKSYLLQITQV